MFKQSQNIIVVQTTKQLILIYCLSKLHIFKCDTFKKRLRNSWFLECLLHFFIPLSSFVTKFLEVPLLRGVTFHFRLLIIQLWSLWVECVLRIPTWLRILINLFNVWDVMLCFHRVLYLDNIIMKLLLYYAIPILEMLDFDIFWMDLMYSHIFFMF